MLNGTLDKINPKYHTPSAWINLPIGGSVLNFVACFWATALDIGQYTTIIGNLTMPLSYLMATFSAIVLSYKNKIWSGVKLIFPVISIFILVFVFLLNIYPVPEYPVNLIPYSVILWAVIGLDLSFRRKPSSELTVSLKSHNKRLAPDNLFL